jgi:drug/metabolite transporter (DMT)-like permease
VSRTLKAHLLLVFITLVWGATFVLVKAALHFVTPVLFVAVRMALAATVLALIYSRHLRQLTRASIMNGAVVGVFLFLGYFFQTTGLRLTTPSKAAFLTGAASVLVPVFLIVFWRAHIHKWRMVGILTALIGLFLMTVPAGRQAVADFANVNRGDILASGCAVAFAFHIIFVGRVIPRFPYEQIAVLQVAFAALFTAICVPLAERPHIEWNTTVVVALLVTAIVCTAIAFTVQAWAQQFTPATHTALIFTLEPVFAWLTSYFYLGERLGLRAGAGALLIFTGVLISELLGSVSQPAAAQESSATG